MREYRHQTVQKLAACTCDRCKRRLTPDDGEWQERLSFDHACGFDSVFGDGNTISLDLCQHCVRDVLGQWLRITQPEYAQEINAMAERVEASAKEASAALDDTMSSVAESNKRIETMADALASMPNVGEDADFARHPCDVLRGSVRRYDDPTKPMDVKWKVEGEKAARRFGRLKGRVRVRHDFDAPLSLSLVSKKKPKK